MQLAVQAFKGGSVVNLCLFEQLVCLQDKGTRRGHTRRASGLKINEAIVPNARAIVVKFAAFRARFHVKKADLRVVLFCSISGPEQSGRLHEFFWRTNILGGAIS